MLELKSWRVNVPPGEDRIGFAGEHLAHRLEINGDLGPEWSVKLELQRDGRRNVIALEREETLLYVDLTRDMMGEPGLYTAQLRGMRGEVEAHSDLFFLRVSRSVGGLEGFPPCLPSELRQLERKMEDLLVKAETAVERAAEYVDRAEGIARGPKIGPAALVEDLLPGEMLFVTEGDPADHTYTLEDLLAAGDREVAGEAGQLLAVMTPGRLRVWNLRRSEKGELFTAAELGSLAGTIRSMCAQAQSQGYVTDAGNTALTYRQVEYYILHGTLVSHQAAMEEDWPWVREPASEAASLRAEMAELRSLLGEINLAVDEVLEGSATVEGSEENGGV